MNERKKTIKRLVRKHLAEAVGYERVHLEDVDAGRMTTVGIKNQPEYGMITLRFGDSYTLSINPEDAHELGEALLRISKS